MILPLRRAHRLFAFILAVLLPILVLMALALRAAPAVTATWPTMLQPDADAAHR